jgi:hypothetical protein
MPPKKAQPPPAKKKAAVDATFGMKNKKGKKGQEVVKQVQNSGFSKAVSLSLNRSPACLFSNIQDQQKAEAAAQRKAEKQAKWEKEQEMALLFRKVEEKQKPQVIPIGVHAFFRCCATV